MVNSYQQQNHIKKKVYISPGASNMAQTYSFQSLLAHLENKEQIILRDVVLGEKKEMRSFFRKPHSDSVLQRGNAGLEALSICMYPT